MFVGFFVWFVEVYFNIVVKYVVRVVCCGFGDFVLFDVFRFCCVLFMFFKFECF